MQKVSEITEEFVRTQAPNPAAFSNAQKISRSGGFQKLCKTADETLIFGECKGSGKLPYSASADFSGESPVFRCSCPSRQFPCKHCLALMLDHLAKKTFEEAAVPEDIARKREKITARAEKAEKAADAPAPAPNPAAAAKKLKKQREGLALAEQFVSELLTRGVSAVTSAECAQYQTLAKQLGDYYLPEPQAVMYEIIRAAEALSGQPSDEETNRVTALCVRLAASVRKCCAYIDRKLESGEVLPENDTLYEAMGGVWKLAQLKALGLTAENVQLMQLAFFVNDQPVRKMLTDTGYWLDLSDGSIFITENMRPYKAQKYIKEEDSVTEIQQIPLLCRYPGGLNPRVRWESATPVPAAAAHYAKACSYCEKSIADAVKKAKNEMKNTLGQEEAAVLLPFDRIAYTAEGGALLQFGAESIALTPHPDVPGCLNTLRIIGGQESGCIFGTLRHDRTKNLFTFSPLSVLTQEHLINL
ncbi:MAG: SWIM zinc finger family protein [Oscillospiraceae bacterium]|nr:SWIM zinc finger family protein [Oscillospiraceae bacterium]